MLYYPATFKQRKHNHKLRQMAEHEKNHCAHIAAQNYPGPPGWIIHNFGP